MFGGYQQGKNDATICFTIVSMMISFGDLKLVSEAMVELIQEVLEVMVPPIQGVLECMVGLIQQVLVEFMAVQVSMVKPSKVLVLHLEVVLLHLITMGFSEIALRRLSLCAVKSLKEMY